MKTDTHKTKVRFLVNDNFHPDIPDIFAYFPDEIEMLDFRLSYAHVGQHSSCHPDYANESRPATKEEYQSLKEELESIGYNLEIIK